MPEHHQRGRTIADSEHPPPNRDIADGELEVTQSPSPEGHSVLEPGRQNGDRPERGAPLNGRDGRTTTGELIPAARAATESTESAEPTEPAVRPARASRRAPRRANPADTTAGRAQLPAPTPTAVHGLLGLAVTATVVAWSGVLNPRTAQAVSTVSIDTVLAVASFCLTASLARLLHRDGLRALPGYYARRFKQTLPWLATVLLAVVAIAYKLSPLPEAREIRATVLAGVFHVANWEPLARSTEGAAAGLGPDASGPLAGMWLLSVLGQFFLVWPVVFAALFLASGRRPLAVATLTLGGFAGAALFADRIWQADDPAWTAVATHMRLVDLCAGATAALVAHAIAVRSAPTAEAAAGDGDDGSDAGGERPATRRESVRAGLATLAALVGTAGLGGLGWYAYRNPDGWILESRDIAISAAVALAAAATALALSFGTGRFARVVGSQVPEELGRMAYAILLLFLPFTWLLRHGWHGISDGAVLGIGAGLTWLLALIVHYTGFRAGRRRWRGWPQRLVVAALAVAMAAGAYRLPVQLEQELRPGGKPLVIGLGDALAGDLAAGLRDGGREFTGVSGVTSERAACGIIDVPRIRDRAGTERAAPACADWQVEWARQLVEKEPDVVVLHLGQDAAKPFLQGEWRSACDVEYREHYLGLLDEALRLVERNAPGAAVVIFNERLDNSSADPKDTACYNQRIKEFADTHQGRALLADLDAYLCATGACRIGVPGGKAFYTAVDSHRLTPEGRSFTAGWVEEQIAKSQALKAAQGGTAQGGTGQSGTG